MEIVWGMGGGGWLWMVGGLVLLIGIVVLAGRGMGGYDGPADRSWDARHREEPMDAGPSAPAGTSVSMSGSRFQPATLTIVLGTTVRPVSLSPGHGGHDRGRGPLTATPNDGPHGAADGGTALEKRSANPQP